MQRLFGGSGGGGWVDPGRPVKPPPPPTPILIPTPIHPLPYVSHTPILSLIPHLPFPSPLFFFLAKLNKFVKPAAVKTDNAAAVVEEDNEDAIIQEESGDEEEEESVSGEQDDEEEVGSENEESVDGEEEDEEETVPTGKKRQASEMTTDDASTEEYKRPKNVSVPEESKVVFVGNLSYKIEKENIIESFEEWLGVEGCVESVRIISDKMTGKKKG